MDRICNEGYSTILLELAQKLNPQPLPLSLNTLVVNEDKDIFNLNEALEVVVVKTGLCNHPDLVSCDWNVCEAEGVAHWRWMPAECD